jgi:hypothetical protein
MGGTLTFPINDDLKAIVEHAAANDPGPFYGEAIDRSVFLVKDHGTYLMSGGKPGLNDPSFNEGKGPKQLVVYANEINPNRMQFDDWYDRQRDICGGDDFVEPLDLQFFRSAITLGATEIVIHLSGDRIKMETR